MTNPIHQLQYGAVVNRLQYRDYAVSGVRDHVDNAMGPVWWRTTHDLALQLLLRGCRQELSG